MRIAFNPSTVAALTSPPNNKDITFDLRGQNIFARGVKFYGTDTNTWRDIKINNVSIGSHTLDLRNGSNTTLTNTNGVVTINSTWRPVVDNLTSNSTTSSLSANQGRVLAGLINGKSDSDHNHDGRYLKLTGGTMLGALNFANGTWNLVGADSYMGDCNVSGHIGIKAANTTYPGIAFFNNASAFLGNLTAYSGNIKYGAYSLQFLDNGNTSVSSSTWTNPFSAYNSNAVADGQAICVWGQASQLSNLSTDTGDMSLWLKRVNANAASLNMVLDGEYYANGNQRLAHVSEIPNKNSWNYDDRYLKLTGGTLKGQIILPDIDVNTSYTGSIIIGASNTENLGIDGNEIMARNNGKASTLYLNNEGGAVQLGAILRTNSNIAYIGSQSTQNMIKFINNTNDFYGNGIAIGGGGLTIIGSGESSDVVMSQHSSGGDENMIIAGDGNIDFYSNLQDGWKYGKHMYLDTNGFLFTPSYINIGGNENNNSSPDRVWGSNGSDSYLRSYRTSALRVAYAGNADTVDGYHASHLLVKRGRLGDYNIDHETTFGTRDIQPSSEVTISGKKPFNGWGTLLVIGSIDGASNHQLAFTGDNRMFIRCAYGTSNNYNTKDWATVALTSDNVASASKLLTARSIWGQSFDGTRDVNGTIYINNGNSENGAIILNNNVNTHARISAIDNQVIFNTGAAIRFGETAWDWNKWAGLKYAHSNKTIYLGIAEGSAFTANSALSDGILRLAGIKTITPDSGARIGNTGGDLFLGNSNNSGWVKVQNIASQADTNNWRIYQAGNAVFKSLNVVGNITAGGYVKNGSNDNYILLGGGGHKALSDFAYGNNYVKAFGTSNSNIDSDWGQSFKTFDPIPSGTPPEQNPNISLLSIGENFDRRKQLAFIWNNDNIYYRRRVGGGGFSNWRRLAFANEIPTSLPANGGNADTVDGEHASSFVRAGFVDNNGANLNSLDTYSFIKSVNSTVASASPGGYTGWYNVIQAVHRNGAGDGPGYIGQIALGMTTNLSAMFYRTKYNGSWYAWNEVLTTNTGLLRYSRNNVNISSPNCSPIPPSLLEWTVGYPRLYDPEFIDGNNDVNVYNNAGNGVVTVTRVHDTNVGNSSSYVMKVVSASGASPNYGGWNVQTQTELGKVYTCLFRASIPSGVEIEFNTNSIGSGGGAAWLTNNMGTGKWTWYAMQVYCGSGSSTTFFFSAKSPCTWYLSYVNVIENNRASYAGLRSVYSDYLKQNASLVFGRSELQYFNQYTGVTSGAKNNANPTTDWYHILRMNHANNSGYFVDLAIPFNNNRIQFRRIVSGSDNGWRRVITEEPNHDVILREANTSGNVGIGINNPAYKLDVNGQIRASGFHHSSVNSDNYMLLAGGGYKSFGGDDSNPIFLGYLNLDHGNDGTISSSFSCLGYSVPFTYTRGGNYCRIYIPDTTHQVFYIKAATASVNYSGGGMDTWTGVHRGSGAWWLHCYAQGANEIRVKGFCQNNNNNDSWWGGNPLWSGNDGANKITVCIFGYVKFR